MCGMGHQGCRSVARILLDAHAAGAGVDQAVAAVTTATAAPAPATSAYTAAPAAVAPPARDEPTSRMGGSGDPWAAPAARCVPAPAPAPGTAPSAAAPVREAADPWAPPASVDAKRSYCRGEWVATKHRWALAVDQAERGMLLRYAASCPNTVLAFDRGWRPALFFTSCGPHRVLGTRLRIEVAFMRPLCAIGR